MFVSLKEAAKTVMNATGMGNEYHKHIQQIAQCEP
jgi:hypothetical protein